MVRWFGDMLETIVEKASGKLGNWREIVTYLKLHFKKKKKSAAMIKNIHFSYCEDKSRMDQGELEVDRK